jgi:hypothetical protein
MKNLSQESAEALILIEARQNSDYYVDYSIGNLQGRKQRNYPKTQRQSLNFNKNINNQSSRKNTHKLS